MRSAHRRQEVLGATELDQAELVERFEVVLRPYHELQERAAVNAAAEMTIAEAVLERETGTT